MFEKVSSIKPNCEQNNDNLGLAHGQLCNKKEMSKYFQKALSINPSFHAARWNLALTQLSMGDYENGWKNYESRFEKENKNEVRIHSWPKCNRLRKTYFKHNLVFWRAGAQTSEFGPWGVFDVESDFEVENDGIQPPEAL